LGIVLYFMVPLIGGNALQRVWRRKTLKKLFSLALGLVTAFAFSACGSNDNEIANVAQEAEQSRADSAMTNSAQEAEPSGDASEQVKLPENYDKDVLYTTVTRGNAKELLYTSRETIEAVKDGQPIPSGSVITLEIYRDGELTDIFVNENAQTGATRLLPRNVMVIGGTRLSQLTSQLIPIEKSEAAFLAMQLKNKMTLCIR